MGTRTYDRLFLAAGVAGPITFVVVFTVLGAMRAGYDAVRQYVSLLELGDGGWMQSLNFAICGVLIAASGVVLAPRWAARRSGRIAGGLVAAAGIGLAWCGVFTGDPAQGYPAGAPAGLPSDASFHAGLHYLGSTVVFAGLPIAILLATRALPDRRWAWYGRISAAVMLGAWIATFVVPGRYGVSDLAGLLQRIAIVAGFGWLAIASARELRRTSTSATGVPAAGRA
jgi:hypothetical protein